SRKKGPKPRRFRRRNQEKIAQLPGITRLIAEQLQHELQKLDPTSIMIIASKEIIYKAY
ncbi:11045_t:CDS:1, partial [Dentiscutata erythropus]